MKKKSMQLQKPKEKMFHTIEIPDDVAVELLLQLTIGLRERLMSPANTPLA